MSVISVVCWVGVWGWRKALHASGMCVERKGPGLTVFVVFILIVFFAAAWTITINWLKLPKCWALKDCFNIWKNTSWNWIVILIRCWADTAENHGQNTSTKYGYCFVVPCFNCSIVHGTDSPSFFFVSFLFLFLLGQCTFSDRRIIGLFR